MKRLICLVGLVVSAAVLAGELRLGTIVVTDGGTANNRNTGTTFLLPTAGQISVHTDEGCFVGVDVSGCDAGMCIPLAANQLFPTSTNSMHNYTSCGYNVDGGCTAVTSNAYYLSVAPPSGGANCHAYVYSRNGKE